MTLHAKAISAALAASFLLGFSASRGQDLGQQVDPSTSYGQSVIQNEQDHQQAVQDQQRDQQNWQDYQQRQQSQMNNLNQPNQGYYSSQGQGTGAYGAMALDPANPATARISYNFHSAVAARAAAKGACYGAGGGNACTPALEFRNACAAVARGGPRVWAARAAVSGRLAAAEAVAACRKAGGTSCEVKSTACSPNND